MVDLVSAADLIAYVQSRGFTTEPVFNDLEADANLRVVGLRLKGPRRNRGFISLQDGQGDLDMAKLWCDGVDYSSAHADSRKGLRP